MQTLRVTDIPARESEAEKNLTDHLKSSDFFHVEKYPVAIFEITGVLHASEDSLYITGNFTIKDITKSIGFGSLYEGGTFRTTFSFDRFQWGITYEGNFAERTLVDRDIELAIKLKTE